VLSEGKAFHQANNSATDSHPLSRDDDAAELQAQIRIRQTRKDDKTRPVSGDPVFNDQVREIRIMQGRRVLLSSPRNNKWAVVGVQLRCENEVEIIASGGAQMNRFHFSREPGGRVRTS